MDGIYFTHILVINPWWRCACFVAVAIALLVTGCASDRPLPPAAPVYEADVEALFGSHCVECHDDSDAGLSYRVDSYLGAIGCSDGVVPGPQVLPAAPRATLLWTLRNDKRHRGLLSDAELLTVQDWVVAGAPERVGGVHGGHIMQPWSHEFHGKLATVGGNEALLDESSIWACGQCHDGAPVGRGKREFAAPGATDCTHCHDKPQGVLDCGTCHGTKERAYPPRDACFHSDAADSRVGAHAAHLEGSLPTTFALTCDACHPHADASLAGRHADGQVDVRLRLPAPIKGGNYEDDTATCAVYCHQRGGSATTPSWFDSLTGCGSCHDSPPDDHFAGRCSLCHVQSNDKGTALHEGDQHLNGRVDVGRREGCGGCHGEGNSPWPDTPSHRAHRDTQLTTDITCDTCHEVPTATLDAGHLDRGTVATPADVKLATEFADPASSQAPQYANGRCANIRCHGDAGDGSFVWDEPQTLGCHGCHGDPPPPPHPRSIGCGQLICHGSEVRASYSVDSLSISEEGRTLHIDGVVQASHP